MTGRKIISATIEISCPICGLMTSTLRRYPLLVCNDCRAKATDLNGRRVSFSNGSGGNVCSGYYLDSKEKYEGVSCYIDCFPCHAEEARFGGIVIQKKEGEGPRDWYADEVDGDKNLIPRWFRLRDIAEKGDVRAYVALGEMYLKGKGVTENHVKAFEWYKKAAERGFLKGQYNLVKMYHKGIGVSQDKDMSLKWFRKWCEGVQKKNLFWENFEKELGI